MKAKPSHSSLAAALTSPRQAAKLGPKAPRNQPRSSKPCRALNTTIQYIEIHRYHHSGLVKSTRNSLWTY